MSNIVDKPFNALQRIIRSVFKGSPNLFTTADVNRQVEALKYQLEAIEKCVGVLSDLQLSAEITNSGNNISVTCSCSYLIARGADFTGVFEGSPFTFDNPAVGAVYGHSTTAYLVLRATPSLVTYADDASHQISGAKFVDGTSQPAADTLVYSNPTLVLTDDLSSVQNIVCILAILTIPYGSSGAIRIRTNAATAENSLSLKELVLGTSSDPSAGHGGIYANQTLSAAIRLVSSLFFTRSNGGAGSYDFASLESSPVTMKFAISNGIFHFCIGSGNFQIPSSQVTTGAPAYLARYQLPNTWRNNNVLGFFNTVLCKQGLVDIDNDGAGEGANYALCVMDTLAEGQFRVLKEATSGHSGDKYMYGRVRVSLCAVVDKLGMSVQSLGIYIFALKHCALTTVASEVRLPSDISIASGPYFTNYDLTNPSENAIDISIEGKETSVPVIWPYLPEIAPN